MSCLLNTLDASLRLARHALPHATAQIHRLEISTDHTADDEAERSIESVGSWEIIVGDAREEGEERVWCFESIDAWETTEDVDGHDDEPWSYFELVAL